MLLVSQTLQRCTFPWDWAVGHRLRSSGPKTAGHVPVFPGAPGLAGLKEQGSGLGGGGLATPTLSPSPSGHPSPLSAPWCLQHSPDKG